MADEREGRTSVAQHEVAEIVLGPVSKLAQPESGGPDVVFTEPGGVERRVPAFASGGSWRVRYASAVRGRHVYRAETSEALTAPQGEVEIGPPQRGNPLFFHGPIHVAADQRHFEHSDGTPFLWLADSWWDAFVHRVSDEEFDRFAAQRAAQGFSVIQLTVGLTPDWVMFTDDSASPRGLWPWHKEYERINLAWFDEADTRVAMLLRHGLMPAIMGAWGFYMSFIGVEKMLRHWREIIARWGAYPVTWTITGEPANLWYFEIGDAFAKAGISVDELLTMRNAGTTGVPAMFERLGLTAKVKQQLKGWNAVARGLRKLDPFHRPTTIENASLDHPYRYLEDPNVVDFWRLQTGETGFYSLANSVNGLLTAMAQDPPKPTLVGEINSEGILGTAGPEMQRFTVWSHLLSGAAGHSYQAVGVWDFTTPERPGNVLGPWGDFTWRESAEFPGATHVGLARKILLELPWHKLEAHPEWVDPHHHKDDRLLPYAAGTPDGLRIAYFPVAGLMRSPLLSVRLLELGQETWKGQFINPRTGERGTGFDIIPNAQGVATLDNSRGYPLPTRGDWVLLYSPKR